MDAENNKCGYYVGWLCSRNLCDVYILTSEWLVHSLFALFEN